MQSSFLALTWKIYAMQEIEQWRKTDPDGTHSFIPSLRSVQKNVQWNKDSNKDSELETATFVGASNQLAETTFRMIRIDPYTRQLITN